MKKTIITAALFAMMGLPVSLWAQEKPEQPEQAEAKEKRERKETEEIVIRKKGEKDINLSLEIKGDQILVNGKPLAEYKGDQITINKRKMIIRDGENQMAFDFGDGPRTFNFNDDQFSFPEWNENNGQPTAFLGVTTEMVADGAKVNAVTKGSAAEKAGLKAGDIITKINDEKVTEANPINEIISSKKPKDEVKVYYTREGKKNNAKATLGERKVKQRRSYAISTPGRELRTFTMPNLPPVPPEPNQDLVNIEGVMELQADALEELELNLPRPKKLGIKIQDVEEGNSVKVIDVLSESPAEKAGLKKDDLIVEIDGKKITNTDEAREQLHEVAEKFAYNVKVKRDGKEMSIDVKIPKRLKTANL